jgi:integrase
MTGSLYRRGRIWWMAYVVDGTQRCESSGTTNKRLAQKILNLRVAEIIEGRFRLPKSNPPKLKQFSDEFLNSIHHQSTRKRYASSVANLRTHFGDAKLTEINAERIDEFKVSRLTSKVRAATVNRDLAVLRRMLKIAERRRLITFNPFREIEMLEERKERRQPHILTFDEEKKLLAVAPDHVRVLAILILDTGLRSGREALALKWDDIDFSDEAIRIRQSKTLAGIRSVPMSSRCKAELLKWRTRLGPEFSKYVFANPKLPETHLRDVRKPWPDALKAAGLEYFWLYDLRHTFASRLTQAGVSPLFVAQIMGHSSSSTLMIYAKAIDEFRRSAISKLESFREAQSVQSMGRSENDGTTVIQ